MRIEGTEARQINQPKTNSANTPANEALYIASKGTSGKDDVNREDINQLQKGDMFELPVSDRTVINAIEKANDAISIANRRFEYSIHEKTKEIMVKVIDSDTNEVIREIPPEKILDMIAKMWEMAGILVDERR